MTPRITKGSRTQLGAGGRALAGRGTDAGHTPGAHRDTPTPPHHYADIMFTPTIGEVVNMFTTSPIVNPHNLTDCQSSNFGGVDKTRMFTLTIGEVNFSQNR